MSNTAVTERVACPDCLLLEREVERLQKHLAAMEQELMEQARRWGNLVPSLVPAEISSEQEERLRAEWEKLHRGPPRLDPAT